MTILHATDEEVAHLLRDGVVTVWRVVKPQPGDDDRYIVGPNHAGAIHFLSRLPAPPSSAPCPNWLKCPLGQPGDTVTIKEAWQAYERVWDGYCGAWETTYPLAQSGRTPPECSFVLFYRADGSEGPWRSSAVMPQWAVRLRGTVERVRIALNNGRWQWEVDIRRVEE